MATLNKTNYNKESLAALEEAKVSAGPPSHLNMGPASWDPSFLSQVYLESQYFK
jgi:hypothetical protein